MQRRDTIVDSSSSSSTTPSSSSSSTSESVSTPWNAAEPVTEQERLARLKRRWKGKARAFDAVDHHDTKSSPGQAERSLPQEGTDAGRGGSRAERERMRLAALDATRHGEGSTSSSSSASSLGAQDDMQAPWRAFQESERRSRSNAARSNAGRPARSSSRRTDGLGRRDVLQRRDPLEGNGAAEGVVLPLDQVSSDGVFDVSYSIPVKFGDSEQQFSLQIDTGSSDLWVASTSCGTAACRQTGGRLYDPNRSSAPTGQDFSVKYLSGSAAGPIVWDEVILGGYSVGTQAMAAATDVQNEPLTENFSGILGLALPLNSIIAQKIPAGTSNKADGAAWASNLFSITPVSEAPRARFLSLFLSRPNSIASYPPALSPSFDTSTIISPVLGIGRHPSALVPDPSKVLYSATVSDRPGSLFWKAQVRAISVYVGGQRMSIDVGRSATGAVWPSAVVDSGVPLILTTSAIANAVYGALGVGPATDGMYYVPCKTPLNMSITLDNRPEIPLHPLDLTTEPPSSTSDPTHCIGLIQADDADLGIAGPNSNSIGDMVLGIPFMRNVYTVMAYTIPNPNGTFPDYTNAASAQTDGGMSRVVVPRLGLMPLTDPTTALDEFNTVRVLQQPLGTGTGGTSGGSGSGSGGRDTGSSSNTKTVNVGGKHLSTPVIVVIVIGGLIALFGVIWATRWLLQQRRRRKSGFRKSAGGGGAALFSGFDEPAEPGTVDKKEVYRLARRESSTAFVPSMLDTGGLSEDELRRLRYAAFLRREGRASRVVEDEDQGTLDSQRTLRDGPGVVKKVDGDGDDEEGGDLAEFGYRRRSRASGSQSRSRSTKFRTSAYSAGGSDGDEGEWGGATLAAGRTRSRRQSGYDAARDQDASSEDPPSSPEQAHFPAHRTRNYSEVDDMAAAGALSVGPGGILHHRQTPSVAVPLLGGHAHPGSQNELDHSRSRSPERRPPVDYTAVSPPLPPTTMVDDVTPYPHGVRLVDTSASNTQNDNAAHFSPPQRPTSAQDLDLGDPLGEFGVPLSPDGHHENGPRDSHVGGMAGIGSAASRMGLGRFSRTDSLAFNRESLASVSTTGTARADAPPSPPIIPASWANPRSPAP